MHSFPLPLRVLLLPLSPVKVCYMEFKLILQVKKIPPFRQRFLPSDTGQGEVGMMVLQEKAEELVRELAVGGGSVDSAA